jgi:hypothetical protein
MTAAVTQGIIGLLALTLMPATSQSQGNVSASLIQDLSVVVTPVFMQEDIRSGETLQTFAKRVYEDEGFWTTVWNDNPTLLDPSTLHAGQKLMVRTSSQIVPEQLSRPLPTPTPSPTPTSTPTPTPTPVPLPAVLSGSVSLEQVYKDAGARFGVPWQILYGLHMTETGGRDGVIGSPGAPQGPMQFMAGTFASYAVDGNSDGQTDINNAADAIYTAANFLAKHGSIENGLHSYGGNNAGVLRIAKSRGY